MLYISIFISMLNRPSTYDTSNLDPEICRLMMPAAIKVLMVAPHHATTLTQRLIT
jgi:hypothetical protein